MWQESLGGFAELQPDRSRPTLTEGFAPHGETESTHDLTELRRAACGV